MLRVGNTRRAPFGPRAATPPVITCAFPLTYSGLAGFGFLEPTISADGQTITQAITAGSNAWAAASLTQTVPGTGSRIIRLRLDALPLMAANGSEGQTLEKLVLNDAASSQVAAFGVSAAPNGTYQWVVNQTTDVAYATGALEALPAFLDMRLRSADAKFDVALPDGTILAADVPYTVQALKPLLKITTSGIALGGIGKTLSCSFVTDSTVLANSPLAGSGEQDSCGTVIADPLWAKVVSLMHFDGAVGAAGLTDEKGVTWTLSGAAASLSDTQKQFGPTSLALGTTSYISGTPNVAVGTGDFVLEGWFYEQGDRAFIQIGNYLLYHSSGAYRLWNGSSNLLTVAGSNLNSWVYVALARVGGNIHFHANSLVSSTVGDTTNFGTPELRLGWYNTSNPAPLYIDEFRATYGADRPIYAKPTGQFPSG